MKSLMILAALLIASTSVMGCNEAKDDANASPMSMMDSGPNVPAGTSIDVSLNTDLSSETAHVGDSWSGVTTADVVDGGKVLIPAGSTVNGRVSGAIEAKKGDRAMLDLEVTSIQVDGKSASIDAATEPVIAGSPRARNLGAIAGGAAAGALIGKAIGGDGSDAAKGAVIGGAAATVGVAASKGYQVVLKNGTVMSFTVK